MNKIFISGKIKGEPKYRLEDSGNEHLILTLEVEHKTRAGEKRKEDYQISAWNRSAIWGSKNLAAGQQVMVQGYLAQRQVQAAGIRATAVEIIAEEFLTVTPAAAHEELMKNLEPVA